MSLKIYNSLTRKQEEFTPMSPPNVGLYTCGMTVYDYAHIGHGRKYVMDDILKRVLTYDGFKVNHVQNVTDVGHLVSDADEGEDKMEKGAKKSGKTVWEVAEYFTDHFYSTMDKLNIIRPNVICRATDHIPEQIEMIKTLITKGFAYETQEAIYFDVTKFEDYNHLFGQKLEEGKTAVRDDVVTGEHKKHPADFALWFKAVGRFADHAMHWESPWGEGFPGWHIECSAMSIKYLGESFDIHTGGLEHMSVHHPNEIAQSEAATGKHFVNYWIHYGHLMVDGKKMSKSLGNFVTLEQVIEKGYDPMALRYFYLTAYYKGPLNFTWQALDAASSGLNNLRSQLTTLKSNTERTVLSAEKEDKIEEYRNQFRDAIDNDLNTPQALAVVWAVLKSNIPSADKYDLIISFDEVLGLQLDKVENLSQEIPSRILDLAEKRKQLRQEGKFEESDTVRQEIENLGFSVKDTSEGFVLMSQSTKLSDK